MPKKMGEISSFFFKSFVVSLSSSPWFSGNLIESSLSTSVAERGETVLVLGEVDRISSKGRMKGTGLHFMEWYSSVFSSNLDAVKLFELLSDTFEDWGALFVLLLQHLDRHALHERLILRQVHLMLEYFDEIPQLQQPTRCSPYFDFFLGGGLTWR